MSGESCHKFKQAERDDHLAESLLENEAQRSGQALKRELRESLDSFEDAKQSRCTDARTLLDESHARAP